MPIFTPEQAAAQNAKFDANGRRRKQESFAAGGKAVGSKLVASGAIATARRIRQSSKPLMNKLETEFFIRIKDRSYRETYAQSITFRLANGVKYTPDFVVIGAVGIDCYEIKGPKMWDDAVVKIKVAASTYPRIHWWMVWKKEGVWMEQKIVP